MAKKTAPKGSSKGWLGDIQASPKGAPLAGREVTLSFRIDEAYRAGLNRLALDQTTALGRRVTSTELLAEALRDLFTKYKL